jgi:hypothetical protein
MSVPDLDLDCRDSPQDLRQHRRRCLANAAPFVAHPARGIGLMAGGEEGPSGELALPHFTATPSSLTILSISLLHPEDGRGIFPRNVGKYLRHCFTPQRSIRCSDGGKPYKSPSVALGPWPSAAGPRRPGSAICREDSLRANSQHNSHVGGKFAWYETRSLARERQVWTRTGILEPRRQGGEIFQWARVEEDGQTQFQLRIHEDRDDLRSTRLHRSIILKWSLRDRDIRLRSALIRLWPFFVRFFGILLPVQLRLPQRP